MSPPKTEWQAGGQKLANLLWTCDFGRSWYVGFQSRPLRLLLKKSSFKCALGSPRMSRSLAYWQRLNRYEVALFFQEHGRKDWGC